ncbi:MAG: RNA polymerase sigma factor [Candidatus Peribacteraceae bacterium]|jgi:RNA polymerase sigma-70 factor (ECF subfamily)|nr:RNA polymerase sigma factor [Candidatus Peribacteraceae bacterium]|tara:strand:+ start:28091 stop:28855 length:765 start_codon:yes stop_codon:yes gene_type:complete
MQLDLAVKGTLAPRKNSTILPFNTEDPQSDEELVHAFLDGDTSAYGTLFEKHRSAVFGLVYYKIGNAADAEELVQDAFMQGMEKITTLRDPKAFGGWIKTIAVRMSINRITRRKAFAHLPDEEMTPDDNGVNSGLHTVLKIEGKQQVRIGMRSMKESDSSTLDAFYFRGLSLKQMADEFDALIGTIKRRLHVARNRLGKILFSYMDKPNGSPQSVSHSNGQSRVEPRVRLNHEVSAPGPLRPYLDRKLRSQQAS